MLRFFNTLMNQAGPDGGDAGAGTGTPPPAVSNNAQAGWYDSFEPDLKGYVETKGFKDPKDLTLAYRNLEALRGVPAEQLLRLPKADDAKGLEELYTKLGRPAKPEDYKIPIPQGSDGSFAKAASAKFHELGLNPQQAQKLTAWYNEFGSTHTKAQEAQLVNTQKESAAKLQQEWGAAYEKNANIVDQVAETFGVSEEELLGLRNAMGPAGAMRFLHRIGAELGEDRFHSSDTGPKGSLSPDGAKARIKQLQADQEFTGKLMKGDAAAKDEWDRLHQWAAAGAAAN